MNSLTFFVEAFHFLRPGVLAALPVILGLWWAIRRSMRQKGIQIDGIAPHLRAALTVSGTGIRWFRPIDGVAIVLLCGTFGAAGPTWSRQADPFAAQSAPVVVVLSVTPTMTETDVAPSRLDRAKHKIRDFLDLRAGARTALVVYAGSAHMVLPMTEDPLVMVPYLEGLSPEIMPRDGNMAEPALELAQDILSEENAPGGIFWVADAIDPADVSALNASDTPLVLLAMRSPSGDDRGLSSLNVSTVSLTPDSADIRRIDSQLNVAFLRAQLEDAAQPWNDRAHWMAWPAALFLLAWFRRGWTMRWVFVAFISMACVSPASVRAGAADWFLTADQQGRLAFDRLDFAGAAELFIDPSWRGFALYKSGQYTDAVTVLSRVETAWAASIQGLAQVKSRSYRDAIVSFETALARDPNYPGAAANLALASKSSNMWKAPESNRIPAKKAVLAPMIPFSTTKMRGGRTHRSTQGKIARPC